VLDSVADPTALDADIRARLPRLEGPAPGALHLCHNQSGLRDYWAVAMLLGSPVEAPFGDAEAARVIGATRSLQFAPGTRYSYCNQNFRILSDCLQDRAGQPFADLLRTRIFDPAGMETAFLAADTRAMPDGTEGYEGAVAAGFRAAENRILWTGDAGLGASLDDMIAWERFIDATRDDAGGLYSRLSAPVQFADGAGAAYGFGLGRSTAFGRAITGHGGALRGWRSHRLYMPAERVSVVVMFNHLTNAHDAAIDLLGAVLDADRPRRPPPPASPPTWLGAWLDPETAALWPGAGAARHQGGRRRRQRGCPHEPRRGRPLDGPAAGESARAPDAPRRRARARHRRPLFLRRAGGGPDRGRRRRRAVRRLFGRSRPGKNGAPGADRAGRLGPALPPRAGPYPARRLDSGVPAGRRRRAGDRRAGRLLAGAEPGLRAGGLKP
jgi:D-aminopeptidase